MNSGGTKSKRRWVLYPTMAMNGMTTQPNGFVSNAAATLDVRAENVPTPFGHIGIDRRAQREGCGGALARIETPGCGALGICGID